MSTQPEPLIYTVDQVAPLLGLSRASVYAAVKAGSIPALTIGRSVRIPKAAFDAFLRSAQQRAPA